MYPLFFHLPSSCSIWNSRYTTASSPHRNTPSHPNPLEKPLLETEIQSSTHSFSHLLPDPSSLPSRPPILHPSLPLFLLSPPGLMARSPPPPRHGFVNHQTVKMVERGVARGGERNAHELRLNLGREERREGPRRGGDVGRGWWRVGGPGQKARAPMREARGWRERLSGRSGSAVSWRRGGMRRPQHGRGCKQRTRREVAGLR